MHILEEIVFTKHAEILQQKSAVPISSLEKSVLYQRQPLSMKAAILGKEQGGIIAEFKRKSPSKQDINLTANVGTVITGYQKAGAAGISVLTDVSFFGGNKEDLLQARFHVEVPVLRKDFVIDPYQIIESKALGADTILLIARILSQKQLTEFTRQAHDLGMEVLVEIHNQKELDKCPADMDLIGVNNRNLETFEVDYNNSIALQKQLPESVCKISESGIHDVSTMLMLKEAGFDGFLIGERFMKNEDPSKACQDFLAAYYSTTTSKL